MFNVHALPDHPVIKIDVNGMLREADLQTILDKIARRRGRFLNGYKVWIVLKEGANEYPPRLLEKVDLAAFIGRLEGLKSAVIEIQGGDPRIIEGAETLRAAYLGAKVPVHVTQDPIEARRLLDLFWK